MGVPRESRSCSSTSSPTSFPVLLVSITLDFATCMLTESTLSYLGFGIPLPTPTWGNLLTGANNSIVIQQYWWRWVFPAAIFGLCTVCINLMGDGLRDAVDPKSNETLKEVRRHGFVGSQGFENVFPHPARRRQGRQRRDRYSVDAGRYAGHRG